MPEDQDDIDYCQACGAPMDVSAFGPFSNVECPSCGEHTRVKVKFGPYTLKHRHAIGGMSMVFVAQDDTLNREVALKILSEEFSGDETRILAFEEEAKITASLSHPNIVRVLRTGKAFGRFYIAMELVTGGHYEYHIRELGRIPEADLLPVAIEVAQGLKAAQSAGLIHRDVKPGNILIDTEGNAKLVDFGLALVTLEGKAQATEFWATPFYVPPETVRGLEEDFRSDIYALGATLYHALSGSPPCNEESMSTTILLKAKQEILPLQRVAPDISQRTCQIIDRAMAFNPQQRFSSYDEMIRQLNNARKYLGKEPAISATKNHRNRLTIIALVAIAIAAAIIGAIFIGRGDTQASPKPSPDPLVGNNNTAPPKAQQATPAQDISQIYIQAREFLKERQFSEAADSFESLANNTTILVNTRSWAGVEATIARYLAGNSALARKQAAATYTLVNTAPDTPEGIGNDIRSTLAQIELLAPTETRESPDQGARQVIAAMLAGLKNWEQGLLNPAAVCFRRAASVKLPAEEHWAAIYQQFASDYLTDHHTLTGPLFSKLPQTPAECQQSVEALDQALGSLRTHGRARFNIRAWQLDLARHSKLLKNSSESPSPSDEESPER